MQYIFKFLEYLVTGNIENWLILKIVFCFMGGLIALYFKNEFREQSGVTKLPFWKKGLPFALISSIGGLMISRPQDIFAAFLSGLVGWLALVSFIKENNKGVSTPKINNKVFDEKEIKELMNNER